MNCETEYREYNPDDVPTGISVEDGCWEASRPIRTDVRYKALRLNQIRQEMCNPDCECRQCNSRRLNEARQIRNSIQMPR